MLKPLAPSWQPCNSGLNLLHGQSISLVYPKGEKELTSLDQSLRTIDPGVFLARGRSKKARSQYQKNIAPLEQTHPPPMPLLPCSDIAKEKSDQFPDGPLLLERDEGFSILGIIEGNPWKIHSSCHTEEMLLY